MKTAVVPAIAALAVLSSQAHAADVWLDSLFGPPDTVEAGSVVRFGAYVRSRYVSWGEVYFLLDLDGERIYEDHENFILGAGDSVLFDWPIIATPPGYYTAMDSLVTGLDPDSTQITWKFWAVSPQSIEENQRALGVRHVPVPSVIRGSLFVPRTLEPSTPWTLFSITGRQVMSLHPGNNDTRHLSPGIYFVRREEDNATTKMVIQR